MELPPPSDPDPAGRGGSPGADNYAPEEIADIAVKLREQAGLRKEPTGMVAHLQAATKRSTRAASSKARTT